MYFYNLFRSFHWVYFITPLTMLLSTPHLQAVPSEDIQTAKKQGLDTRLDTPATSQRKIFDTSFNPAFGVILNGEYLRFSESESEIPGFAIGEEGERPSEGFSVDHTEINVSANADNAFLGSITFALAEHAHGGEHDEEEEEESGGVTVELEEAYIQTLPGFSLLDGMSLKIGSAFWTLGYLNEHHNHVDDFSDRPLAYRAFLNNAFNDDGIELSYVLPIDFYTELGAGAFHGRDYPNSSDSGQSWSSYVRFGSDIGDNHSFRLGASQLVGRSSEDQSRSSNENKLSFIGATRLYLADFRYIWVPTGNARNMEIILQGEYLWLIEDGSYEDKEAKTNKVDFLGQFRGWYGQLIFKFHPQWRIGLRYSRLEAPEVPEALQGGILDSGDFQPKSTSVMFDWTNSEFSRIRFQYNREELTAKKDESGHKVQDDQYILQYIVSLGAHSAHKY